MNKMLIIILIFVIFIQTTSSNKKLLTYINDYEASSTPSNLLK